MYTFIQRTFTPLCLTALSALFLHGCAPKADAPLLEGKINVSEPTAIAFVYDHEGENIVTELTTDSTGVFTYNPTLEGDEADLVVYVGQDLFGAYVKSGCSTHMVIDGTQATFTGDNLDRCRFNNTLYQSFSPWTFKPTPDHPFQLQEWTDKLNQGYERTQKAVEAVSDPEARARYQRLADATHKYYKLQILFLDRMMNQADNEAETDSLLATIDPNADETRLSGLINYWYNQAELTHNTGRMMDLTTFFTAQINAVDSALTNEGNKRSLYNTLTNMFFLYQPSDSDITAFRTAIAPQLAKAPRIAEYIEQQIAERANQIKNGDALPSDPTLIARDGTRTTLSQVIQGKVAYIVTSGKCGNNTSPTRALSSSASRRTIMPVPGRKRWTTTNPAGRTTSSRKSAAGSSSTGWASTPSRASSLWDEMAASSTRTLPAPRTKISRTSSTLPWPADPAPPRIIFPHSPIIIR